MKNAKRATALLVALVMSLAFTIPAFSYTKPIFQDVSAEVFYSTAVEWAYRRDITKGTTATTFEPDAICTRGQVVTFLWRAAGRPEPKALANPFTDVKEDSTFYKAILWAYENGITSGTSKTEFSPGSACTRAQVITFLWRAQGKPEAPHSKLADSSLPKGYWTDAYRWADSLHLLSVTDVSPDSSCPRSDIVYYLYCTMGLDDTDNGNSYDTGSLAPSGLGTAWGITLTAKNVTTTGMTLVCAQSGGTHKGELSTGTMFMIEKLSGGAWTQVPYKAGVNVGWEDIQINVPLNNASELAVNWELLYGELPPGQYRIGKQFTDMASDGKSDKDILYAQFTIPDAA